MRTVELSLRRALRRHHLGDTCVLIGDLAVDGDQAGFGAGDIRRGLRYMRPEIRILDRQKDIPGPNRLIVADGHMGDITFNAGTDDGNVAFDISVVGFFQEARGLPPIPAARNCREGSETDDGTQDQLAHDVTPHSNLGRPQNVA